MGQGHQQGGRAGGRRRARLIATVCAGIVVLGGGAAAALYLTRSKGPSAIQLTPAQTAQNRLYDAENAQVSHALARLNLALPKKAGKPAPGYSSAIFAQPLPSHQVFAYLPYWYLTSASAIDYSKLTTLAYFALGIDANGAIQKYGLAWQDMQSKAFAGVRTAARAAHVRLLLTVARTNAAVLDSISQHPAAAASKLVSQLRPFLKAGSFDGVDLDLEGTNGADREGYARFVKYVADGVHALGRVLAVDVYPQSAGDPTSFYDPASIGRSADQLFIMGYDMENYSVPSANAPLTGTGITDAGALQTYTQVVPRSKLILGTPWYGVDWTLIKHRDGGPSGSSPITLVYSQIVADGHTPLWDPGSASVWFRYQYKGHQHEVWYDNGLSLAIKTALAAQYRIAGVGMWAIGMDGGSSDLLSALAGGAPVVKLPVSMAGSKA